MLTSPLAVRQEPFARSRLHGAVCTERLRSHLGMAPQSQALQVSP